MALRSLLGSTGDRGFTAIAIVTLALGMGANTAIYSAVDGVLLRPAPITDLERLVMIWETDRDTGTVREPASFPDYTDFVERSRSFGAMAAFGASDVTLAQRSGEPQRLPALSVTRSFLPLVGITPYGLAQRRREIAIRLALGERPSRLKGAVLREAFLLGLAGLGAGLLAAYALTRLLAALLFGLTPTDPLAYAAVPVILLFVALAASYIPARRATHIEPATALKGE